MSSLWFDCRVAGVKVGSAIYHNTVDLWRMEVVDDSHSPIGEYCCRQPMVTPPQVQAVDPHPTVWAEITNDNYPDERYRLMYCEQCRCLVPPPVDDDGYYMEYPKGWMEKCLDPNLHPIVSTQHRQNEKPK